MARALVPALPVCSLLPVPGGMEADGGGDCESRAREGAGVGVTLGCKGVVVGAGALRVAHSEAGGEGVLPNCVAVPGAAQAVAEAEGEAQGVLERLVMPVALGEGGLLGVAGRVAGVLALALPLPLSRRVTRALLL